jgi:hypothetical protein
LRPWHCAGLCLLVLLTYANALGGVFQFDDFQVIVEQNAVHSLAAWWADVGQGIRPLLKLSYTLNWLSGWGAMGFIATNLVVHALTVCLVARLSQYVLSAHGMDTRLAQVPWLAAALFALHPAQTEAISYISGRSASLMALLYLAGLWAHATVPATPWSWRQRLEAPLCFALALGIKETAVTFPLALLLWDVATGMRWQAAWRKSWASWAVLLLAICGFLASSAYRAAMLRSLEFNTLVGNAATQLDALVYLARQWALPLWLNIDPDLPVQQDFAQALPGLLLLLAALALAAWSWRRRPWLGFGLAWALLHWLPLYLVLPRLDVANDRQLYLAIWPLGLALAAELLLLGSARIAGAALAALLLAAGVLTLQRNHDFRSELALWQQTVALSPDKSRVHNNLGYAYQLANQPLQARREFVQALQLDPDNFKARLNLRRLNLEQGSK